MIAADLHSGLEAMQRAAAGDTSAASRWGRASRQDSTASCDWSERVEKETRGAGERERGGREKRGC